MFVFLCNRSFPFVTFVLRCFSYLYILNPPL